MPFEDEFCFSAEENPELESEVPAMEEFASVNEIEEFDERFFHSDEFNREFCGGLKEKEDEENDNNDDEAFFERKTLHKNLYLFEKVANAMKMGAMLIAASFVVASAAALSSASVFQLSFQISPSQALGTKSAPA